MATPLIQIESLVKQYTRDTQVLTVLDKLTLTVEAGDFVAARRGSSTSWPASTARPRGGSGSATPRSRR